MSDSKRKAVMFDAILATLEPVHAAHLHRPVCQEIIAELMRAVGCGEPWRWGDPIDPSDVEHRWRAYFWQCGCDVPAEVVLDLAYDAARAAVEAGQI